jgi:RNA polymerase sigma factor (sigma-70 family)
MIQISKPSCSPAHGFNASAQVLIESHLPFARAAAGRVARKSGVPFDDLFSAACMGLTDAAPTFDPERGFAFATYALRPVMNRLRDECRGASSIVKRPRLTRADADPSEPKPSVSALKFSGGYKDAAPDTHLDAFEGDALAGLCGGAGRLDRFLGRIS